MSMVDKYLGDYFRSERKKQAIVNLARTWGKSSCYRQIAMLERIWKKRTENLNRFKVWNEN